jgi:PhnB protein
MQISTNLTFDGTCEEAFALYARLLGGTVTFTLRYRDSPMAGEVPDAWAHRVLHTTLMLPGGGRLFGYDAAPGQYEPSRGFSLSTNPPDLETARAVFAGLAEGGSVTQPLEPTFWALAFGTLVDRYGIPWAVNCEPPQA